MKFFLGSKKPVVPPLKKRLVKVRFVDRKEIVGGKKKVIDVVEMIVECFHCGSEHGLRSGSYNWFCLDCRKYTFFGDVKSVEVVKECQDKIPEK